MKQVFDASALSVAPLERRGPDAWYYHFSHFDTRPERVASFERQTRPAIEVANAAVGGGGLTRAAVAESGTKSAAILASVAPKQASAATILAFADPSPKAEGGALAAIRSMDESDGAMDGGIDLGALDIEDVPVPVARPQIEEPPVPAAAPAAPKTAVASLPRPAPLSRQEPAAPVEKAPSGGLIKKLFGGNTARPGNKIAVYDISAAKVYMPDGSVLEAHSGIGKMADNPRYVHVKMNGPTPPQTYDLKMRESRFHGVEAVRMTPVGKQTMHGRDGMLTHSYLLRGRPGQSHGCVAFKEYHKFLAAFKKGHVKRIIVVPGGGAGVFARANSRPGDA